MFDVATLSLSSLPTEETDELEYKSSLTPMNDLKRKLQNAASAFWNTGDGVVDGGISASHGRQSISDWIAQSLFAVRPNGEYKSRLFDSSDNNSIAASKCVVAIQYLPSKTIPHQSYDNKYYIRAGAHTIPAPHEIVEALFAKRQVRSPRIVHLARRYGFTSRTYFLNIELVNAAADAAFDVSVDLEPWIEKSLPLPIGVSVIDREHSYGFRFEVPQEMSSIKLQVYYHDFAGKKFEYHADIDLKAIVEPWNHPHDEARQVLEKLAALQGGRSALG